ncbi:hypothetical protein HOY80DRAFT_1020245 [Tuber brumale]|nr:hypothetical protein HOY80DRAFT_1020245 [Tuber brumale]
MSLVYVDLLDSLHLGSSTGSTAAFTSINAMDPTGVFSNSAPLITMPCPIFDRLSCLIPASNQLQLTKPAELGKKINEVLQDLGPACGCYLMVKGVTEEQLAEVDVALEKRGIRNIARFTYENAVESLIIRLMPGAAHERTAIDFYLTLIENISSIPGHSIRSIRSVGCTQFQVPGRRSKQGDAGLMPATRQRETDWPSLMIEVGYSESLPLLRCDAQWWLLNSGGQTRMVIVMKIKRNPNAMRIECWEMIPPRYPRVTRSGQLVGPRPGFRQSFDIDNLGTVTPTGRTMIIPYHAIFDIQHPTGRDVIFSTNEISSYTMHVFSGLH